MNAVQAMLDINAVIRMLLDTQNTPDDIYKYFKPNPVNLVEYQTTKL